MWQVAGSLLDVCMHLTRGGSSLWKAPPPRPHSVSTIKSPPFESVELKCLIKNDARTPTQPTRTPSAPGASSSTPSASALYRIPAEREDDCSNAKGAHSVANIGMDPAHRANNCGLGVTDPTKQATVA